METRRDLAYDKSIGFLHFLLDQEGFAFQWDREKNRITGNWNGEPYAYRLPPVFPIPPTDGSLQAYLDSIPAVPPSFLLILIQSGHSAIAYIADGDILHHKVIKKYMVRGNGRSQVGYLQSRGKSKAGSRIRLANTVLFFEDINEKLREWDKTAEATRILVSCTEKLRPLWFGSDPTPPFEKDDPRIAKVPHDVHRPDSEELARVHKAVLRARWEGPASLVDDFFAGE